ncbi:anthranilate synthase component I [candidate division WOR-1 bacterium RIFCSPHIGHO2_01_FULL_53_15]|uniref:Anthranilate synthase component 1 n=1 Tax=candidate division WOR-1 bacterium RIFCSPHIGHO2_01_FULL_53_15 TaxID=1802564 RepID=A0A1F4PZC8_UNCSA|nr:MAG: anthranilate synthase component I [candidate division WOR-1 bacterium RIFCSPHIGHO2_01_FULL_53_15]OGC10815.1 MAG: anthranilate synthase component I [candidate division WOR-1 bacterium RIFCSPHIGHO2_02_FULL_53_26]
MFYPSEKEFTKLSKKGNLIPVYKEIVADMETPVSAFKKIESEYSFLLESVEGGEKIARYSFLGSCGKGQVARPKTFEEIRNILKKYRPVEVAGLPRFSGGLVGYVGYDAVRLIEKIPDTNPDDLKLPMMQFMLADTVLAFDHIKHKILIIANAHVSGSPKRAYEQASARIAALEKKLDKNINLKREELEVPAPARGAFHARSNLTKAEFEAMVRKAKAYINAGDIIQVVPSQRFEMKLKADPLGVYRILRIINPSPYMYFLRLGDVKIIGSSPEVMVRLEKGRATLRPIAGTRKRGKDEEEDRRLMANLLASKKERAEHVMLVDLGRNDLGRVCDYGSVKVTEEMVIEKYSHVMHIVSNVTGKLRRGLDAVELLKATFPAGTVSGAPKVRAMEIIDELENVKRGLYAGSVGYFGFSGDLDSGIAIRTILVKGNRAFVQAGGGVVADSSPEKEYQESVNKARALIAAVELAK